MDKNDNDIPPSGCQWCNSGGHKNTLIKNLEKEVNMLKLDGDEVDGLTHVNQHSVLYTKLKDLGAKYTEVDRMTKFINNIIDPDFSTLKQLLDNYHLEIDCGNCFLKKKEFADMAESWQCKLDQDASAEMEAKLQSSRFSLKGGEKTRATPAIG
eukprot:14400576-Ditylum_brightwellii.AAC.1